MGMPAYTPGYAMRVGRIPVVPYYRPGSRELAEAVSGVICRRDSLLLANHGMVAAGKSPAYVCRYCLLCVAETAYRMVVAALEDHPGLPVVFAGGVMSSDIIQKELSVRLPGAHFVPGRFSSDNAIGVALLAAREVAHD